MNVFFKCTNIHPCACKRLHRSFKPFWNSDLQNLWNELRKAVNKFCKSTRCHVRAARKHFKASQKAFDRVYRREERIFKRARLVEMEEVVTNDPKKVLGYTR